MGGGGELQRIPKRHPSKQQHLIRTWFAIRSQNHEDKRGRTCHPQVRPAGALGGVGGHGRGIWEASRSSFLGPSDGHRSVHLITTHRTVRLLPRLCPHSTSKSEGFKKGRRYETTARRVLQCWFWGHRLAQMGEPGTDPGTRPAHQRSLPGTATAARKGELLNTRCRDKPISPWKK